MSLIVDIFITTDGMDSGSDPLEWDRIDMFWPYCFLIALNLCILGPIGIVLTYSYYQKRKEHIYSARRPELVVRLNIASIFFIMVYLPLHILWFEILYQRNGGWQEWWEIAAFFTAQYSLFCLLMHRIFHTFYDFRVAHVLSETQWKSILSQEYGENQAFVLKHKNFLGISPCISLCVHTCT